ncbi:hypothetical protein C8Q80DRAFT_298022 [Daedaleopsis nitida]|nr:hypothetical protein C8Q80DRAFT_298022 [Daedaleopsis nitida]
MALPDGPALALDDIIHNMSPSPAPQPLPPEPAVEQTFPPIANTIDTPSIMDTPVLPPRIQSPEPLDHSELEFMRTRVQQYSLTASSSNPRESELAAMVRPSMLVSTTNS